MTEPFIENTGIYTIDKMKSELDLLFESVHNYRTSKHYKELLDFCRRFRYLAPFNAMMVQIQRPGANMVLTSSQWFRWYNRRIKPNARPVVILTFSPVSYLFDISDTEPLCEACTPDEKILEEIHHQFDTRQSVSQNDLGMLKNNLPVVGVAYTDDFRAGNDYGAQLMRQPTKQIIKVDVNRKTSIEYRTHFLISINETLGIGARYSSIMHELGHYFCQHLPAPERFKKWKKRELSHNAKEFEAESVAWLTCNRLGIDNPSEFYLVGYLDEYADIPEGVSIDYIFKAHNEIWKLLFNKQYAKDNYLYKNDEYFKLLVNEKRKRNIQNF